MVLFNDDSSPRYLFVYMRDTMWVNNSNVPFMANVRVMLQSTWEYNEVASHLILLAPDASLRVNLVMESCHFEENLIHGVCVYTLCVCVCFWVSLHTRTVLRVFVEYIHRV